MSGFWLVFRQWQRDRRRSTIAWTIGMVLIIVATAAFYPSLASSSGDSLESSSGAMSSLMGLSAGIDPTSPLGYLWIGLYANIVPWVLMALGIALGTAAIASDEDTGALEYTLSRPITRTTLVMSRFAGAITILALVAVLSGVSLAASVPLFELGDPTSVTGVDGTVTTQPGVAIGNIVDGTLSALAVGVGSFGVAFLVGAATGRRGTTLGVASAVAIAGYVFYTLSEMTSSLDVLTWASPWRWYIDDVMLIDGLDWDVLLPFGLAAICLVVGWQVFLRRDLQNP